MLCTIRGPWLFLVSHGDSSYALVVLACYAHIVHVDEYVTNIAEQHLLVSSTRLLSGPHLNSPVDAFHAHCIPSPPPSRLHRSVVQNPEGTAAREYQNKTWPNPLIFLLRKKNSRSGYIRGSPCPPCCAMPPVQRNSGERMVSV